MAPDLILVVAGLSAAWAVFSIVGGERQRVLQNAESLRRGPQATPEPENEPPAKRSTPAAVPLGKSSNSSR
jgi:hypothetical protein